MKPVILITGASSGIGLKTALKLLERGAIVYGGARHVDNMKAIAEAGGHAIALDVTSDSESKAAVDQILAEQGRIDVLINNAGYGSYGAVEDAPIEEAKRQLDVNVLGIARLTKLVYLVCGSANPERSSTFPRWLEKCGRRSERGIMPLNLRWRVSLMHSDWKWNPLVSK